MYYYHRGLQGVPRNINSRDSWTWNKKQYIENTRGSSVNPPSGEFTGAASHKLQLLLSSRSSHEMISSSSTFFVFVQNFYNQFLRFLFLKRCCVSFAHAAGFYDSIRIWCILMRCKVDNVKTKWRVYFRVYINVEKSINRIIWY